MINEKACVCPLCGGALAAEFIGQYGDVYKISKDGNIGKRKMSRNIYDKKKKPRIFCLDCGNELNVSKITNGVAYAKVYPFRSKYPLLTLFKSK